MQRRSESASKQHSYQRNLLRSTAVDIWERALLLIQLLDRFLCAIHQPFRSVASACEAKFSSVQFYPRWYYALGKAHNYARHPVSQTFLQCRLRNSSNVRLIDDGPLSSFQGRSSSASSFHAFLLQAIDSLISLVLYAQVVSQAPQHVRSSKKQATSEGCFAPPVYLVRHFPSLRHVQGSTPTGVFEGGGKYFVYRV